MASQSVALANESQSWITTTAEVFNEALAPALSGAMVAGPSGFTFGAATGAILYYVQKQHPELADSHIFQFFKHGANIGVPFLTAVVTGQTCLPIESGQININPELLKASLRYEMNFIKPAAYKPTCIGVNAVKCAFPYLTSKLVSYLGHQSNISLPLNTVINTCSTLSAGGFLYMLEQVTFNPAVKYYFN